MPDGTPSTTTESQGTTYSPPTTVPDDTPSTNTVEQASQGTSNSSPTTVPDGTPSTTTEEPAGLGTTDSLPTIEPITSQPPSPFASPSPSDTPLPTVEAPTGQEQDSTTGSSPTTEPMHFPPTQLEPNSMPSQPLPVDSISPTAISRDLLATLISEPVTTSVIVYDPTVSLEHPSELNTLPLLLIAVIVGLLVVAFIALLLSVVVGFVVVRKRRQPRRKTVQVENGYRAVPSNDSNSLTSSVSDSSSENRTAATNPMVHVVEITTDSGEATGTSSVGASLHTDGGVEEENDDGLGPEPCKKTDLEQDMEAAILELSIAGHDQRPVPGLEVAPPTPEHDKLHFYLMAPGDRLTPDSDLKLSHDRLTPEFDLNLSRDRLTPDFDFTLSRDRLTPNIDLGLPGDRTTPDFSITMSVASAGGSLSDISIEKFDLGALVSEEEREDDTAGTETPTCDTPNTADPDTL